MAIFPATAVYNPIHTAKDNGLTVNTWTNAHLHFTVDKNRLAKRLGQVTVSQMERLAQAIVAILEL